jgi:hypothetical protein
MAAIKMAAIQIITTSGIFIVEHEIITLAMAIILAVLGRSYYLVHFMQPASYCLGYFMQPAYYCLGYFKWRYIHIYIYNFTTLSHLCL